MSQSMEVRARNAEMKVSCTRASRYPSDRWTIGTTCSMVTVLDGESGEEKPSSLWTSADCRRASELAPIDEPLFSLSAAARLTLNSRAEIISDKGTTWRLAWSVTAAHSGVDLLSERHSKISR
jgi:hypothetical protein